MDRCTIFLRLDAEQKISISLAADAAGQTMNAWCVEQLVAAAEQHVKVLASRAGIPDSQET